MARKTTMWLTDDDLTVREALGRALFVENVQIAPDAGAFALTTDFAENPFFKAQLDLDLETESEWDTFYTT